MIDYRASAIKIYRLLSIMFPSVNANMRTEDDKRLAVKTLASTMQNHRVDELGAVRMLHWASCYNSQFAPSIGEMISFSKVKTPNEYDTEYKDDLTKLEAPVLSEKEREANKIKFAKLIKSLGE